MLPGLLLSFLFMVSCGDLLVGPDPKNTPVNNFDILWGEFDRYYSFFEHKKIDWDSLYSVYRPLVSGQITGKELFNIVSNMLDYLKDGHVNVYTPFGNYNYSSWKDNYPIFFNINMIKSGYLESDYTITEGKKILYGKVSSEIGYMHIFTFGSSSGARLFNVIDTIIEELSGCKAFIIDVRNNGGGSSSNAEIVASRFTDRKRSFAYVQYRNGPDHSDFTDYIPLYIEPRGDRQFTQSVALLTNRRCFSATEHFILSMKVLPYVTVIGDTTGGGFGNPIHRELPNGWAYRLPVWMEFDHEKNNFEGIGLAPDIPVQTTAADSSRGIDTILETAIQFLSQ